MKLSRSEILKLMEDWSAAWNRHDFDAVMERFHDDVLFENWTGGRATGKEALRKAWTPWFENHGGFVFRTESFIPDEEGQRVTWQWTLEWPSLEKGFEGKREIRRGIDAIELKDGKVFRKCTYSKTTLEIDGRKIPLAAAGR
ncbi:MAG TPA: nuclear transport factor 2 family protein [Syntrophales bacterium]|nr:nuclear transport factor 2 family protein [Syntrophales bacterium]HPX10958.1 nuclear transport factor 2 family protein [Syntrophales bacterium]HQB30418.1 nuclear transport factor 2 family protein [Syntrophales bacterium]HQN78814.1 nuclear transport factor 2 family protein [Syntrophales bacterium]HQQ27858.1 nuclear transport factor 2 family protein [Syntrophales bacterium]